MLSDSLKTVGGALGTYVVLFGAGHVAAGSTPTQSGHPADAAKGKVAVLGGSAAAVGAGYLLGGLKRPNSIPRGLMWGGAIAAVTYLALEKYVETIFKV